LTIGGEKSGTDLEKKRAKVKKRIVFLLKNLAWRVGGEGRLPRSTKGKTAPSERKKGRKKSVRVQMAEEMWVTEERKKSTKCQEKEKSMTENLVEGGSWQSVTGRHKRDEPRAV